MTKLVLVTDEQLGVLARRQNDLFRRVREGTLPVERVLAGLQSLIEGCFEAVPPGPRNLIDCDVRPYVPYGLKFRSHQHNGMFEFDPNKVGFHLHEAQKGDGKIQGICLLSYFENLRVMNACVLDHLLANTGLIPESWKRDEQGRDRGIYFWGTVYLRRGAADHHSARNLCVRYLYWDDDRWDSSYSTLEDQWGVQNPAAVFPGW